MSDYINLRRCYNCMKFATHKAKNCPESQVFTRCGNCDRVVFGSSRHEEGCANRAFISVRLVPKRCYNCNKTADHIAKGCPERQLWTRCNVCERICHSANGHLPNCNNTGYRSIALPKYYRGPQLKRLHESVEFAQRKVELKTKMPLMAAISKVQKTIRQKLAEVLSNSRRE